MISKAEMKALEDEAAKAGTPKLELMERAGKGLARVIEERFDLKGQRILFVCYHGNNGGDGMNAALHLARKAECDILFLGDEDRLKPEAKEQWARTHQSDLIQFPSLEFVDFDDYAIIVDALLGLSFGGELRYPLGATIEKINQAAGKRVCVDVPTGMDPDAGTIADKAVKPDLVVTFHDKKKGLERLGEKVVVVDIGLGKD